jgi:hypothetical protein
MQPFMRTPFKRLLQDKIILVSFWGSIACFVMAAIVVALAYPHLPPFLPLYNKLAWGYDRLGHTYEIVIPYLIPLLFVVINTFLARTIYEKIPLLARFLFLINLLLSLFTCIFIIKLTLIIL